MHECRGESRGRSNAKARGSLTACRKVRTALHSCDAVRTDCGRGAMAEPRESWGWMDTRKSMLWGIEQCLEQKKVQAASSDFFTLFPRTIILTHRMFRTIATGLAGRGLCARRMPRGRGRGEHQSREQAGCNTYVHPIGHLGLSN